MPRVPILCGAKGACKGGNSVLVLGRSGLVLGHNKKIGCKLTEVVRHKVVLTACTLIRRVVNALAHFTFECSGNPTRLFGPSYLDVRDGSRLRVCPPHGTAQRHVPYRRFEGATHPVGNALCGIPGGGTDYACTPRMQRHGGTFPTDVGMPSASVGNVLCGIPGPGYRRATHKESAEHAKVKCTSVIYSAARAMRKGKRTSCLAPGPGRCDVM